MLLWRGGPPCGSEAECLHAQGQDAVSQRCMLPLIDLCNHAGTASNCCLSMRLTPCGQPRFLELCAAVLMCMPTYGAASLHLNAH